MKVNKKQMQKWIDALRSGKFEQGVGFLQSSDGFCCLGVACKLFARSYAQVGGTLLGDLPCKAAADYLPSWVEQVDIDMENKVGKSLATMNDTEHMSFDEIADILQAVYIEEVLK